MSVLRIAAAAGLAVFTLAAGAQTFPTKPVSITVAFSAGGPTDTIARIVAQRMTQALGQTVVVENVTGAGGAIGVGKITKAAPDGYALGIGHIGTHVINGAVYQLPYDLLKDLEPVGLVATNPQVFENTTGTKPQIVHYRGAAPAMQDVVAGHIDLSFDQAASALPLVRSGKVRAYAVTSKTRLQAAPEIPTVDEAGLPGFYMAVWHGIWAPANTPKPVIARLNAAINESLADPATRKRLADLGQEIPPKDQLTPEAHGAHHKAEIEKWWPLIKAAGIKAE
jgi:tripartite-type tricarboxylate transporter receptor subunit TctC